MRDGKFERIFLPGLAFKATVIGGGYATGRELAEYFIPSGPQGGLLAILIGMLCWSAICALTFAVAHATRSFDYRRFFVMLLGRFAFLFELAYLVFMVLILAVFGAAAGEIFAAMLGWPTLVGTLLLIATLARQIHKQHQADSVEAVSTWLFVGQMTASVLFIAYSALVGSTVFVVTNSLILLTAIAGQCLAWIKRRRAGK